MYTDKYTRSPSLLRCLFQTDAIDRGPDHGNPFWVHTPWVHMHMSTYMQCCSHTSAPKIRLDPISDDDGRRTVIKITTNLATADPAARIEALVVELQDHVGRHECATFVLHSRAPLSTRKSIVSEKGLVAYLGRLRRRRSNDVVAVTGGCCAWRVTCQVSREPACLATPAERFYGTNVPKPM